MGGQLYNQQSSYGYPPQGTGSSYLDSAGNSVKKGWQDTTNYLSGLFGSNQSTGYGTSSGYGYGGKRGGRGKMMMAGRGKMMMAGRGKMMMMGGNFSPNTPLTGLAANAEPISGVPTASAQMVGGRTRRRRNKHRKSCKKSCRKH
jgi:hypothetical protein